MLIDLLENYIKIDYCYNCKGETQRDYLLQVTYDPITKEYLSLAECHVCKKIFLYVYEEDKSEGGYRQLARVSDGITKVRLVTIFPKYSISKTDYVPRKIADSYNEALRCMENNAPNGAVSMFRRALQQICILKKSNPKDRLEEQVKVLPSEIRPDATELRKWGNLGAHEDDKGIIDSVTIEDAKLAKDFLERVFFIVFEYPEKIKHSQNRRQGN